MFIIKKTLFLACLLQVTYINALYQRRYQTQLTKSCNFHGIKNNVNNKLRVKRNYANNNQSILEDAITLSKALKQLFASSDVYNVPKSGVISPLTIHNGSNLFGKVKNKSGATLLEEEFWEIPKTIPRKDLYRLITTKRPANVQDSNKNDSNNVLDLYKKLANDFQILQQFLAENRNPNRITKKPDDSLTCITTTSSSISPSIETKNIIMLENMSGSSGNFTRITLLKKKISEQKKQVDLPINMPSVGGNISSDIEFEINSQKESELFTKKIDWK